MVLWQEKDVSACDLYTRQIRHVESSFSSNEDNYRNTSAKGNIYTLGAADYISGQTGAHGTDELLASESARFTLFKGKCYFVIYLYITLLLY